MVNGETKNVGQIAVLWISAYQPENTKLIWYDTIERIHKVYETSTGTWTGLNPQVVTNSTLDNVRTYAQHYGLTVGKFYYLTDVGSLAIAISATKIWYVDSNGNYIVNDLVATVQAYVNSDNLLIDGSTGVWDIPSGTLRFDFTKIENGELADSDNDYVVMRRKNGGVWSWLKLRLKNLISSVSGNNLTWNKGLYFSLLNSLREIMNHQGGVVGYDSYQSDKQQITNSINQIVEGERTILNAAKDYTDQETAAAKIYAKKHSGAWNILVNPPATPGNTSTLNEILQILVSWTNVLQKAGKILLGNDFAAAGRSGEVAASDSVRAAIEKLVYKSKHLLDGVFVDVATVQTFTASLSIRNIYMINEYPADYRVFADNYESALALDDDLISEGIVAFIPREDIEIMLTGIAKWNIYLNSDCIFSILIAENDMSLGNEISSFNLQRNADDYSVYKINASTAADIANALNSYPTAAGIFIRVISGQVDVNDSFINPSAIYFGYYRSDHPSDVYKFEVVEERYGRLGCKFYSHTQWNQLYDFEKDLWKYVIRDKSITNSKLSDDALIYDIRNAMGRGGILPLGKIYMYDKTPLEMRCFADNEHDYIVFGFPRGNCDYDSTPYPYPSMLFTFFKNQLGQYIFGTSYDFDFCPTKYKKIWQQTPEDGSIVTSMIADSSITNQKIVDGTITGSKMASAFLNAIQTKIRWQDYNGNTVYPVRDFKGAFTFEPIAGEENLYKAILANSSDERLKENKNPIELTAEQIAKMPAISFNFINDKEKEIHVGTIAQEWEKILPQVVRKGYDGYLSMDYAATALVSAITLAKEVEKQKDEIRVLKETIKTLQGS